MANDRPGCRQRLQLLHVERFEQSEAEHLRHLLEGVVLLDHSLEAREGVLQFEPGNGLFLQTGLIASRRLCRYVKRASSKIRVRIAR